MGALRQAALLLWKNVILRVRYPGILLFEVLWPILVVGIIAIMRTSVPPYKAADCYYQPRAMPSSGAVSFLQTFICNLGNTCYQSDNTVYSALSNSNRFTKLAEDLAPYLGSDQILDMLAVSQKSATLINKIEKVVEDKDILRGLDRVMNTSSYFRDPDKVKAILVNDYKLPVSVGDAVMKSKLNVVKLLDLMNTFDFQAIVCDPNKLISYLKFPEDANVVMISTALCSLNDSDISNMAEQVTRQLNITVFIDVLELFEKVKERFGVSDTLSLVFHNIGEMIEVVMPAESVIRYLGNFAGIANIADILTSIPDWIKRSSDLLSYLNVIKEVVFHLQPLMVSLKVENSTAWAALNDGSKISINIVKLTENEWNGTVEEFVQPMKDLLQNIKLLSREKSTQDFVAVFEIVMKIDWLDIYNDIRTEKTLNKQTVMHILETLQDMLETMPGWSIVQKCASIAQHGMEMFSIFTEKSTELKYAMRNTFDDNAGIKSELNRLFQNWPIVTRAVLESLTSTQVLADIIRDGSTYLSVCDRVVTEIQTKVPVAVYKDVYNTLCAGDVMDKFDIIIDGMKLSEIRDLINITVSEIENLYVGDIYARADALSDLYNHYNRLKDAISIYRDDKYSWTDLFLSITFNSIDFNEAGWEAVKDLLKVDFLTNGFLGLCRNLGQKLQESPVSREIAPYVHMLSSLSKLGYDYTNDFTVLYASDFAFMKAGRLLADYMSDIVKGIYYMWHYDMDDLILLASSLDPFDTFCTGSYIIKMNMSTQVSVSELNSLICNTDWTEAIMNFIKPAKNIESTIAQMIELFNSDTKADYDFEMEWVDMMNYTEKIIDIFNSGYVDKLNFVHGYMTYIMNMNFSKLEDGFDILLHVLKEATTKDVEKCADFVTSILVNLDRSLVSDSSWHDFKWYMAWLDAYLDIMTDSTQLLQNISIQAVLNLYPSEVRDMTSLLASAYPQFVAALKNLMLDPAKLIDYLLQDGFKVSDCENKYVADYILLPRNSAVHSLEKFICDFNITKLTVTLIDGPPVMKVYAERMSELLLDENVSIDWFKFVKKMDTFIKQISSLNFNGGFVLSPFNISAIDMSWEEFYKTADILGNMDSEKIVNLVFKIQDLTIKLNGGETAESDISSALYTNIYVSYHFIKMLVTEMTFFNTSTKVVLSNYLGSSELKKLTDIIVRSPDINAVGAATLQRLLASPESTMVVNLDGLCSDLSLFSKVVVVEASFLAPAVLQKTVCDLNINFTLLLEQVENNRPSVKEFIKAMKVLFTNFEIDDIRVNLSTFVSEYKLFVDLLQSLILNPPAILLSEDDKWMNLTAYTQQWEALWRKLIATGKDLHNSGKLMDWESSMTEIILTNIEKVPGTERALAYIDVILDYMQNMLDHTASKYEHLKQYPNVNKVLDLLNSAPEAVQSLLYTVLTQPEKTLGWNIAIQSWTVFCNTPVSNMISVPPELDFSMSDFIDTACYIDSDAVLYELLQFQGWSALEQLNQNETTSNVNASTLHQKFDKVFTSMSDLMTTPTNQESNVFTHLMNVSAWEQIGEHLNSWLNDTEFEFSSLERISQSVTDIIEMAFETMPPDVIRMYSQALAVAEVIVDQMMLMLDSNTLNEAFKDLPTWQTLAALLNELPELFETVVYTSLHNQEMILEAVVQVTSWKTFCNAAENMLSVPPSSTFNYKNWLSKACSVNITLLIDEIGNYSLAQQVDTILNSTFKGNNTLKSVINKAESIINKINEDTNLGEHVFDASVWNRIIDRVNPWTKIWTSTSAEEILFNWGSVVTKTLLTTVENIPGTGQTLAYIDAVLDMIASPVNQLNGGFGVLYNYTNVNIILRLLESSPEAVQTLLYTIITEPAKTAKWSEVFQSMNTFCNTPASDIMSVPSVLKFSISDYVDSVCKLDLKEVVQEFARYQGTDRLQRLLTDGVHDSYNLTMMIKKFHKICISITDFIENPAEMSTPPFMGLFNSTLWDEVSGRIEVWADKTKEIYSGPGKISEIVSEILNVMFRNLTVEITEMSDKTIAITDIILDQVLVIISSSSLNASVHDLHSLQIIVGLLNELPELYETVLYSSMYFPEKTAAKISQLTSLEAFCLNNPQDMFTLAPNSSFDLNLWLLHLCSIDTTSLVNELQDYAISKEIERLINGPYLGHVTIISIIDKAEQIVTKLNGGININERVFDSKIWDSTLDQVNSWVWPYKPFNDKLMDWESSMTEIILTTIEKVPGTKRALVYMGVILDYMQNMLDHTISKYEDLKQYPNVNKIMDLLNSAPEAVQSLLYTVLTQPEKTLRWNIAIQSWTVFCNTPVSNMISVPPELDFSMSDFIDTACHIDSDALLYELLQHHGWSALEQLNQNETTANVNASTLHQKFDKVFTSMSDLMTTQTNQESNVFTYLMNVSAWEQIGEHLNSWLNDTEFEFSSIKKISQSVSDIIEMVLETMPPDIIKTFNQAIAVAEVIVDQMMIMLDSNTLNDAFKDLPTLQTLTELLNELPELFETVVYTSLHNQEKISEAVVQVTSWKTFCNAAENMLAVPPSSTFNYKNWLSKACSVNITLLIDEIVNYNLAHQVDTIINRPFIGNSTLKLLVYKAENIINKINKGADISEHVFDTSVWDRVIDRVNSWTRIWTSTSAEEMVVSWGSVVTKTLLMIVEKMPGTGQALTYIDAVLNLIKVQVDQLNGGYVVLYNYTNVNIILRLLESSPEAVQTLLYTIITEPAKTAKWSEAFQSMNTFCNTPASDIMSVPSVLKFSISEYVDSVCKLNFEELVQEFARYQGTDRLQRMLTDAVDDIYNITMMSEKFHQIFISITDSIENPAEMSTTSLSQVFNNTLWHEVRGRIEVWADKSKVIYSGPDKISEIVREVLNMMFRNLPAEIREMYDKTIAVTDIIFDQVLVIISSNSLNASVHDLPSLQIIVGLLNELPELYETVLYSSMYFPEKTAAKISQLTSLEAFCLNNPQDMFTLAPNSSFDLNLWLLHLCSINTTSLVNELQDYTIRKEIERLINGPYLGHVTIISIIDKAEQIVTKLNGGININERVFDSKIWDSTLDQVNSWVWPYKSFIEFLKEKQKWQLKSFIAYIENTPGAKHVIYYLDAVLDIIDNKLEEDDISLPKAFKEFPTLTAVIELVEQAPDMIDSVLYTLLAHPEKILSWPDAVQTLIGFCSKNISKIMSVAPDSHFDLEAFTKKLCNVSIEKLVSELTSFQGFNRLHTIVSGNVNSTINTTALLQKADLVFSSLEYYYSNSPNFGDQDLRLFDSSVWSAIGDRVHTWSNITTSKYLNAHAIAQIFELTFGQLESLSPEVMDSYDEALAITSVLIDEVLMVMEASSLQEALKNVPSLYLLMKLANQVPELLETLVYTSVFYPDKVTFRAASLVSFEIFCNTDIYAILSIPPDLNFDLQSWISMLCSLNFVDIEIQLADYKSLKDIENIVNGSSNSHKNMTSLMNKIDNLINHIEQGMDKSDLLLSGSIWTYMTDRVEKYIQDYSIYDAVWRSTNTANLMLSNFMDSKMLQNMAKSLNTINLFMNVTIAKLQAISDGTISFSAVFTSIDGLARLIETYISVGKNLPQSWINGEFDADKLVQFLGNISQLPILCDRTSRLASKLTNATQPSETVRDMSTFICSVIAESLITDMKVSIQYDDIEEQLATIWSSSDTSPGFAVFANNVEMFIHLVDDLSNRSIIVNSDLTNIFDITSITDALQQITTNPAMIFRLLKLLGLGIEGPFHQQQDVVKMMSGINTFAIVPIINLLDAFKARNLNLMTIASNPETLLDALSTIVDFDTQFSVIETVVVKPQLQQLIPFHNVLCNSTGYEDYLPTQEIDQLILPVPWQELLTLICETADTDLILKKMKEAGLSSVQIMVLVGKMSPVRKVSDLPDMYNHDFGWIDLMTSLENLADLVTQNKIDQSKVHTLKNAWESVKDIVFDKSFGSFLSYLNLLDNSPGKSEEWIMFKQYLRFFSSTLHFIDGNLQKFGSGTEVQIQDVLPDSNKVTILIDNVFGTSGAATILTASIDPIMFYRITLYESWDEICKGNNSLSKYFHFPEDTDVLAIQASVCMAVTNRSSSFMELLSLFDTGNMLKQLNLLINAELNETLYNNTVWDDIHSTALHFIHTAENFQHEQTKMSSVYNWFSIIVNTLYSLQEKETSILMNMCNTMIPHLNNTDGFKHNKETISRGITVLNLVSHLTQLLPELDELACIFVTETEFDWIGAIKKLQNVGFWDNIIKTIDQLITPPEIVNCSLPIEVSLKLVKMINLTVLNNGINISLISQCMSRTGNRLEEMITSFNKTNNLIKEVATVLQIPDIQELLQDPNLLMVLTFFFDAISSGNQGMFYLTNLLTDSVITADYLMNTVGLLESVVNSFLAASVNKDWLYFLTQPTQVVTDILCNPDKLSQVISLPSTSAVNITEISLLICTTEITQTVNFLKNFSILSETINEMMSKPGINIINFIEKMTTDLANIIVQFKDLFILMTKFMTGFDINVLKDNADILDKIAQGHNLTNLANSLDQLVDDIALILPINSESQMVITSIEKILKGILSLDTFKDYQLGEVQVKDLVKDPEKLMLNLTSELGFSNSAAQEITNAFFSSRLFFGVCDSSSYTCEDVLKKIIIINSTQATVTNVSDAICALDKTRLSDLIQMLVPELNIGILVSKYITNIGSAILKTTNLTAEELDDLFKKLSLGVTALKEVSLIIKGSPNGSDIINIFGSDSANSFISLNKLTPVLCGIKESNIFDMSLAPGVIVTTNNDIQNEFMAGIEDTDPGSPNDFCDLMYENIKNTGIGSILWSYIKPILRGKILFTPNNTVTRSIMNKANRFFDDLNEVSRVAKIWATEAPNLIELADAVNTSTNLRDALDNDFIKGLMEASAGINTATLISGLDAFQVNNFDKNQLHTLQKTADVVANYSSCIDTDRFQPVGTESQLEKEAYRLSKSKTFFAGIVFLNVEGNTSTSSTGSRKRRQSMPAIPVHIGYKIRMDVDNVMDTQRLKSPLWKMSREDNFVEDMRYLRGFIYIQDMIDRAVIGEHKNQILNTPGFKIRQMPFPCHREDSFIFMLGAYLIPVMMTFTFLASLGVATHNLVSDRENGQEENLHVMGMMTGLNIFSWFVSTMFLMAVVSLILAIMLKYTNIFIYSNFFIMFLYILDFCFSSVMLLYMVSAFFTNTTMAILFVLMVYLISYMPYILLVGLDVSIKYWQKTLACLASTTAFSFGAMRLAYLEEGGTGIQWNNITESRPEDASFSWVCIMMLIDSAGYFLIGWYVRNVKPGKYGISQPWYFPVKPSFWCSYFRGNKSVDFDSVLSSDATGKMFELPPIGLNAGIAIKNLSKTYSNKKKAIEDLTVNFYQNQITSLLGHNGAAKTTTMKIICGILEPTSGHVFINGVKPKSYNHSLGVCPQQNSLFPYMTVLEHMKLYAGIKGINNTAETQSEIKKLLRDVDLWYVKNTPARNLSYGMKRRLCVALAFVGGSKTIILDEPTSGVDPHARKNIWNLITENKSGRTILLSTHHLDEADILSDRIAIMHQGNLLCCGSPAFLKRAIGIGFSLTVVKKEQDNGCRHIENNGLANLSNMETSTVVCNYIQSLCPEAVLLEQVGTDMTFKIPKDLSQMKIPFYQFFRQLDESSDHIGIASYGLSDTTIEEVFLNVTETADRANDSEVSNPAISTHDIATHVDSNDQTRSKLKPTRANHVYPRRKGATLVFSQIGALLLKRCHHYRRNWRILLTAVILPLIGLLISMGFSSVRMNDEDTQPLVLDPSIYGSGTNTFYRDSVNNMMSIKFMKTLTNSPVGIGTSCMKDWAADYFDKHTCVEESPWYNISKPFSIVGCPNFKQVYTNMPTEFSVLEKRVASDELLQNLDRQYIPSYLLRTFEEYKETRYGGWTFEAKQYGTPFDVDPYVWFSSKGYHAMPSFFNSLSNIVLRSQLPSDKVASEYGITTINHPIRLGSAAFSVKNLQGEAAEAGVSLVIVIAFSFIPSGFILYLINERIQKERQLQNISGVHFITYWSVAFTWDLFVYTIVVGLAVIIVTIFKIDSYYMRENLAAFAVITWLYGWAIIPCLYCVNRAFSKGSTAYLVTFCVNLFVALITVISLLVLLLFTGSDAGSGAASQAYTVLRYLFLIFPQYSLGQGLLNMASNTVKYKVFLRFEEDKYDNPFSTEVIGWHLVALGCEGLLFFILTLALDGLHVPAIGLPHKNTSCDFTNIDDDVLKEQERIQQRSSNDLLVIDDLSKVYRRGWKKFEAVSHISFGVSEGESFGLLGINGAGKTTTFRILTGDSKASSGAAYLKGHKISPGSRQEFGYCSQEGGLDDYLTGDEMLCFHSRLHGFNEKQTRTIVNELLTRLSLTQYANKSIHTYSGGTKRKLALAVALLGDPPILYLDEPTTGMDAATRRLAWKCIERANRNGQSIVLTSHSMDECDTLCSRLAIMVNGKIKCIGSPQYLKHKFGDGYTVVVHASHSQLNEVIKSFLHQFPATVVKAKHYSSVELRVPQTSGSVSDILALLQSSQENSIIDYYSLSQTTLDSVFTSFVQEQSDNCDEESSSGCSTTLFKSIPSSASVSSSASLISSLESESQKSTSKTAFTNPLFIPDEMGAATNLRDSSYYQGI